ncbi:hypothetical protein Celaphus_00007648 [Cervus elaphus hippelaphus]|uniref:Uncharacterized protein n=1 Tax=Cervus elaphus hippelaphus TaxID=46360 RepID=A0A212CAM3_CEREH|nr:hypothetical protein Celaphus_00007648 [Cervus elaphus hippelaphus]
MKKQSKANLRQIAIEPVTASPCVSTQGHKKAMVEDRCPASSVTGRGPWRPEAHLHITNVGWNKEPNPRPSVRPEVLAEAPGVSSGGRSYPKTSHSPSWSNGSVARTREQTQVPQGSHSVPFTEAASSVSSVKSSEERRHPQDTQTLQLLAPWELMPRESPEMCPLHVQHPRDS